MRIPKTLFSKSTLTRLKDWNKWSNKMESIPMISRGLVSRTIKSIMKNSGSKNSNLIIKRKRKGNFLKGSSSSKINMSRLKIYTWITTLSEMSKKLEWKLKNTKKSLRAPTTSKMLLRKKSEELNNKLQKILTPVLEFPSKNTKILLKNWNLRSDH